MMLQNLIRNFTSNSKQVYIPLLKNSFASFLHISIVSGFYCNFLNIPGIEHALITFHFVNGCSMNDAQLTFILFEISFSMLSVILLYT